MTDERPNINRLAIVDGSYKPWAWIDLDRGEQFDFKDGTTLYHSRHDRWFEAKRATADYVLQVGRREAIMVFVMNGVEVPKSLEGGLEEMEL